MLISSVLGVWLHVLIDGIYHWDVWVFWPSHAKPLYKLLGRPTRGEVKSVCIAFFAAAIIVYVIMLVLSYRREAGQPLKGCK